MLVQAQNQNERASDDTIALVKQNDNKSLNEGTKLGDLKSEMSDDERTHLSTLKQENDNDNDKCVDDINIDPRTYCKLGHFHLLLEDYPKGKILRSRK